MYRQLVSGSKRPATHLRVGLCHVPISSRKLATPPSSPDGRPGQASAPEPGGSNTLILLSAVGALGGLYYYYARGQPATDREAARRQEEEAEKRVKDIGEAGRHGGENVAKDAQRGYGQVKDGTTTTRTQASEVRTDVAERARQSARDAQAKFDDLKNSAERKLGDVRDSSERKFEEGKEEATRQARDAENKARGWFGWGGSK